MKKDFEKTVRDCHDLVNQGLDSSNLIIYLYEHEATMIESMKVLIEVYGLPLDEAKSLISTHPIWKDVASAAASLHDELEREMKNQ